MRTVSESELVSKDAVKRLTGLYALPCMTALMAASRTAMTMLGTVSGSNPARWAKSSAVRPTVSTLSRVEPSVRETRLVVESGNEGPCARAGNELDAGRGDDGSLLVEFSNVKDGRVGGRVGAG